MRAEPSPEYLSDFFFLLKVFVKKAEKHKLSDEINQTLVLQMVCSYVTMKYFQYEVREIKSWPPYPCNIN